MSDRLEQALFSITNKSSSFFSELSKQAGVSNPQTFDEFIELVDNLIDKGQRFYKQTNAGDSPPGQFFAAAVLQSMCIDKFEYLLESLDSDEYLDVDETLISNYKNFLESRKKEFIDQNWVKNFVDSIIPERENFYISSNDPIASYTNFFNTIFLMTTNKVLTDDEKDAKEEDGAEESISWRKIIESWNPPTQCRVALNQDSTRPTIQNTNSCFCYICGCQIVKTDDAMECEHILPISTALSNWWIAKPTASDASAADDTPSSSSIPEKRNNFSDAELELLQLEYAWAHRCCNQIKSSVDLIQLRGGAFSAKRRNVTKLLQYIYEAKTETDTSRQKYDCVKALKQSKDSLAGKPTKKKDIERLEIESKKENNCTRKRFKEPGCFKEEFPLPFDRNKVNNKTKFQIDRVIDDHLYPLTTQLNYHLTKCENPDLYTLYQKFKLLSALSDSQFLAALASGQSITDEFITPEQKEMNNERQLILQQKNLLYEQFTVVNEIFEIVIKGSRGRNKYSEYKLQFEDACNKFRGLFCIAKNSLNFDKTKSAAEASDSSNEEKLSFLQEYKDKYNLIFDNSKLITNSKFQEFSKFKIDEETCSDEKNSIIDSVFKKAFYISTTDLNDLDSNDLDSGAAAADLTAAAAVDDSGPSGSNNRPGNSSVPEDTNLLTENEKSNLRTLESIPDLEIEKLDRNLYKFFTKIKILDIIYKNLNVKESFLALEEFNQNIKSIRKTNLLLFLKRNIRILLDESPEETSEVGKVSKDGQSGEESKLEEASEADSGGAINSNQLNLLTARESTFPNNLNLPVKNNLSNTKSLDSTNLNNTDPKLNPSLSNLFGQVVKTDTYNPTVSDIIIHFLKAFVVSPDFFELKVQKGGSSKKNRKSTKKKQKSRKKYKSKKKHKTKKKRKTKRKLY